MQNSFRSLLLSGALGLCLTAGAQVAQATPFYLVQTLGALGSQSSNVAGFNGSGTAVGFVTDASGMQVPVTFSGAASVLPGGAGEANGVNNSGVVVGDVAVAGKLTVSEWTGGTLTSLGITGYGQAINSSGEIAGAYLQNSGSMSAFTYANGQLQNYGNLGSSVYVSVAALNDAGEFTGTGINSGGYFRAFLSTGGGLQDLGTLSTNYYGNSYGLAISQSGWVAGASQINSGALHAFLYNGTSMQDLGTLGGISSTAYGVNDSGVVVGESFLTGNQQEDGFIYQNGVMSDLNVLLPNGSDWHISDAVSIDGGGDILAVGTESGQAFALELTPVATPEPAAFALMGMGLVLVSSLARRRTLQKRLNP